MSKLTEYIRLKKVAEQAQQKADRTQGSYDTEQQRLRDDFGCSTIKVAVKKEKFLAEQERTAKAKFEKAVEVFEDKWPDESDDE